MDFKGKRIWITGASSGIGRAVALELAAFDTELIISGRNRSALEEVVATCQSQGATVIPVAFDLGDPDSVKEAADLVIEQFGTVDALYHFGGISQRSFASETDLAVDRKIFEVNYFGTIGLTKYLLPSMIASGGGHIVVTSSVVGKFGFPYRSSYSASKQALHGFFESLRAENAKNNIRVSLIIPGRIRTNISVNAVGKSGEPHGQMDQGQAGGMPADKCAKVIVRKIRKEKKEILVGGKELMMVHIRRFFPALYYYLSTRVQPL